MGTLLNRDLKYFLVYGNMPGSPLGIWKHGCLELLFVYLQALVLELMPSFWKSIREKNVKILWLLAPTILKILGASCTLVNWTPVFLHTRNWWTCLYLMCKKGHISPYQSQKEQILFFYIQRISTLVNHLGSYIR